MPVDQALGKLIIMANPYAPGAVAAGTIGFVAGLPAQIDPNQIQVEEDNYAAQWAFKGLTQNIKRALKIQYSYEKTDDKGTPLGYRVTEHLLVGFAGSNGEPGP